MNEKSPTLDIVIVDYNSAHYTIACVESILSNPPRSGSLRSIIVIDNGGSASNSKLLADGLHSTCTLIHNKDNRGFAVACNQGASLGDATHLLFLNPDTLVTESSLDAPIEQLESSPAIGIVGVQLRELNGAISPTCRAFPRPSHYWNKAMGLTAISRQHFPDGQMALTQSDASQVVDQVIGAFLLIRRGLFDKLHGFDERFFVYFEEVDLCLRARQLGYASIYLADAYAYHIGGGASESVRATRLFYYLRSRLLYADKHFGRAGNLSMLLLTLLVEPVARVLLALARGQWRSVRETIIAQQLLVVELLQWLTTHDRGGPSQ